MSEIVELKGREILDSRGDPTVEAEVVTKKGRGRAAVPSGASTGEHEALELRDGNERYRGKGVKRAVSNVVDEIQDAVVGMDCRQLEDIDRRMIELDGTGEKSNLGANAMLAVSMAAARATASERDRKLYELLNERLSSDREMKIPRPFMNILNGGEHAGNDLAVQEFMVIPRTGNYKENLRAGSEIYHQLEREIAREYGKEATNVGDEGGFAPPMKRTDRALDLIVEASQNAGYDPGEDVVFAVDAAASEFHDGDGYGIDGGMKNTKHLMKLWEDLLNNYPIVSIEDPFHEEDFDSFSSLNARSEVMVVGDDLLVTNPERIRKAAKKAACDTLLLKVNQIGTVTEALEAAELALSKGWKIIVSHRSGETCDTFISDLSVALGAHGIKAGAPARGERTSKYNRLLRIEEDF